MGSTPLTPISEVLVDSMMLSLYGGCTSGGGKKHEVREPQERLLSSPQGFLQSTAMDTMIAYFSFVRMIIYSIIAVTFAIIAAFSSLVVLVMPGVP